MQYRNLITSVVVYLLATSSCLAATKITQIPENGELSCRSQNSCINCRLKATREMRETFKTGVFSWSVENPATEPMTKRTRWTARFCGVNSDSSLVRLRIRTPQDHPQRLIRRFSQWVDNTDSSETPNSNNQPSDTKLAIYPNSGALAGGETVTIIGAGFSSNTSVTIGNTSCSQVQVSSSFKLTCKIPAGTPGKRNVVILNDNSNPLIISEGYTYVSAPKISTVTPSSGQIRGGQVIVISGAGFGETSTVAIGGINCPVESYTATPAMSLTCLIPAHDVGIKDLVVTNSDGQSGTLTQAFTYYEKMAPTVASLFPNYGQISGGTSVNITGSQFIEGAQVTIGGASCTTTTFNSSTSITCVTPSGSNGAKTVVVTNPDGQSFSVGSGFTYGNGMVPTISSTNPNYGPINGSTLITISGSQFSNGARITIGGISCDNVTFISSTNMTCITPVGSNGAKTVVVINPDNQSASLSNGFTYSSGMAPTVSLLSPNSGSVSGGTAVNVIGSQFMNGARVTIGGVSCDSTTYNSLTSITCITPPGSNGAKAVVVTNPDSQSATLSSGFTYSDGMAPTISSISPNNGPISGGTSVTVTGSQFMNGARVTIGGVSCNSVTYNSATSLTCITPPGSYGVKSVVVTNPDAQAITLTTGFTYSNGMAPTISTIAPNSGPITGGTAITIIGSGYSQGTEVSIGGLSCSNVMFINSTSLSCITPVGTIGAKSVLITNPDNQSVTLTSGFTYGYNQTFLHSILGSEKGARLGSSVTTLGDITADGLADFAVSAPQGSVTSVARAGKVYVHNGATGSVICSIQSPTPTVDGLFGYALAYGDMNGDNKAELVVGEPGATVSGFARAGAVHIFDGDTIRTCASSTLATVLRSHQAASPEANARFGLSLATGLIDADSNYDLIVGEPSAAIGGTARGRVSTFNGANGVALFATLNSVSGTDLAYYGFAVTALDMNGDGRSDIAVGEPGAPNGGTNRGKVYVYDGTDGSTQLFNALTGSVSNDFRFGYSLANAGRVNYDSREDLIVGEPFWNAGGSSPVNPNRGRIRVISYIGGTDATTLWTITGPAETDAFFGLNVAGTGDMDGDGLSEFLATSPYADAGGTDRGRVTIFRGSVGISYFSLSGVENGALFASAAQSAGDVDGDGYPDLLIGEPEASNGGTTRGRAYVYLAP